jgi:hypothetical protein
MSDSAHHIGLSLFHIFIVSPFFIYVAFVRGQLMPWVFTILQVMGLLVLLYHAYKILVKWRAHSLTVWVNVIHVLAVAPLVIYIGCMAYDTPRWAFEVLAMLGFAALGYHIYSIIITLQGMSKETKVAEIKKISEETRFNEQ